MKKICIILVLVLILMTACTSAQPQGSQSSGDISGLIQQIACVTLEEFEAYLSGKQIPDNFIHWNQISKFGAAIYFMPTSDFPERYIYIIKESVPVGPDTQSMTVEITHTENRNLPTSTKYEVMTVTSDMEDLRIAYCDEVSVIIRNGIQYLYHPLVGAKPGDPAGLNTITWYENGVKLRLYGDIQTFNSPLMNKLLSVSETEATEAVKEIKEYLTK